MNSPAGHQYNAVPDWWEWEHFTNLASVTSTSDHDGDGFTDAQEYIADTNPGDAQSFFRLFAAEWSNGVQVACAGSPSRFYHLEQASGLTAQVWAGVPGQTGIPGDAETLVLLDTNPPTATRHYRLRVAAPR